MPQAKAGDNVKVHYTGTLEDGTKFDSSVDRGEPLEFTVGAGMMIPGFDQAVEGMEVGDKVTVDIEPAEGYGEVRPDMIATFPKDRFPEHIKPEVGQQLQLQQENGAPINVTVTEVTDEQVTLDANHFLAGKTLTFEIELVEVA